MRTTIDLDEDVLTAAKVMAARAKQTPGKIISEVFRRGLRSSVTKGKRRRAGTAAGFEVIPAKGRVVTPELVGKLLEDSEG